MLIKLSTEKTISEAASSLETAITDNNFGLKIMNGEVSH